MYPVQTDSRATMVRMILLACLLIPEPVRSHPVGSELVGAVSDTDSTQDTYIMYACANTVQSECNLYCLDHYQSSQHHVDMDNVLLTDTHSNHKARTCSPMQDY